MSLLATALTRAGRTPTACPVCARVLDPTTGHDGTPLTRGGRRVYCTRRCRQRAATHRRHARTDHHTAYALLLTAHEQEAAGQLSLDPAPLPDVPQLELTL